MEMPWCWRLVFLKLSYSLSYGELGFRYVGVQVCLRVSVLVCLRVGVQVCLRVGVQVCLRVSVSLNCLLANVLRGLACCLLSAGETI